LPNIFSLAALPPGRILFYALAGKKKSGPDAGNSRPIALSLGISLATAVLFASELDGGEEEVKSELGWVWDLTVLARRPRKGEFKKLGGDHVWGRGRVGSF